MKQLIPGGLPLANLNAAAEAFASIHGHCGGLETWSTTTLARRVLFPTAVTINRVFFKLSVAPGTGKSYTFAIRVNGVAPVGASVTISDDATSGVITNVAIAALDDVDISCTPAGTPDTSQATWGMEIETGGDYFVIAAGTGNVLPSTTADRFNSLAIGGEWQSAWAIILANYMPVAGAITSISVKTNVAPGTGNSWKAYIMYNTSQYLGTYLTLSGASKSATQAINTNYLTKNLNGLQLKISPVSGPASPGMFLWGCVVTPVTVNQHVIYGNAYNPFPTNAGTLYQRLNLGGNLAESGTLSDVIRNTTLSAGCVGTLSNFCVSQGNMGVGTGKSLTYTIMKNGNPTDIVVVISNSETSGVDETHTVTFEEGDTLSLRFEPSESWLGSFNPRWGIVATIVAPSTTNIKSFNGLPDGSVKTKKAVERSKVKKVNNLT